MRARRAALSAAHSWGYQLRIQDLAPVIASTADLLVIDQGYTAKHNGKTSFEPAEVASLKTRPDGKRRIVLAYLSIGEAEQYRFYWQGSWCKRATAPAWMGAVNPDWPGNYPVRFWDAGWQKLILDPVEGYLAKIKAQGFEGIYLDRADVYSEWTKENPHAEKDMVSFLGAIATAARAGNPDFLVVMQNAEELLAHPAVRRDLDGVAKEDLLFGVKFTEEANSAEEVRHSVTDLNFARHDGIPVFAVEYLSDPVKITAARERLTGLDYVPTFAPRLLDSLPAELQGRTAGQPAGQAPAAATPASTTPGPSWAEGAPTCLVD